MLVAATGLTACLHADNGILSVPAAGSGPERTFTIGTDTGRLWLRLRMPAAHQVDCYAELQTADGARIGYIHADGLHQDGDGQGIEPGGVSDWVDMVPYLVGNPTAFRLYGLFDSGKRVSGWGVQIQAFAGEGPPPLPISDISLVWPELVDPHPEACLRDPLPPHVPWLETTAVMQPWFGRYCEAMILHRDEWIPKLRDELGMGAIIIIPPKGDIEPNYEIQVYRDAVADYHAAGMKVIMYWSIMHVGHHDAWHVVTKEHPEWAQRDPEGNPVTTYGDLWLCPNTGALDYVIDLGLRLFTELDADAIMLDNNEFIRTEAGLPTGYCGGCQEAFAEWARTNLPGPRAALLETGRGPGHLPLEGDPLYNEWIEWRYIAWRDATERFRQAMRAVKPDAVMSANTAYDSNWSLAVHGQFPALDVLLSESRNRPGSTMSVKLKYARSLAQGKHIWNYLGTWVDGDSSRLVAPEEIEDAICTCLAHATSPWLVGYGYVPAEGIPSWNAANYTNRGETSGISLDTEISAAGDASVRLHSATTQRLSVFQQPFVRVSAGTTYRFSCSVREHDVTPGRARVRLTFVDEKSKAPAGAPYTFYAEAPGGTHDWQTVLLEGIVAPEGSSLLNLEPFLWDASGTVWYDDLVLTEAGSQRNLLENPGFEMTHDAGYAESYAAAGRCLRFGKDHAEYLRGLVPYNNVAVLASRRSTDFGGAPRAPYSVMQSLLRANIGFDVIADEDLEPGALGRYRVLVLDNARCMAEEALKAVADWVHSGGSLVSLGQAGTLDEFGRAKPTDGLLAALGVSAGTDWTPLQVGAGRVVALTETADAALGTSDLEFVSALGQSLIDLGGSLVHVLEAGFRVEVHGYAQPASRRIVIAVDSQRLQPEPARVRVRVPLPDGWGRQVKVLDLDDEGITADCSVDGNAVTIATGPIRRFALIVIE